eukprot:3473586-Rhodomonas_salina.7
MTRTNLSIAHSSCTATIVMMDRRAYASVSAPHIASRFMSWHHDQPVAVLHIAQPHYHPRSLLHVASSDTIPSHSSTSRDLISTQRGTLSRHPHAPGQQHALTPTCSADTRR